MKSNHSVCPAAAKSNYITIKDNNNIKKNTYKHICMYVPVCIYICMYVCLCVV